jgi:hypothetical protein
VTDRDWQRSDPVYYGRKMNWAEPRKLSGLPFHIFLPVSFHFALGISRDYGRNGQIRTASRKGFFKSTKPLQTLAETRVRHSNVKYVFLTADQKSRDLSGIPVPEPGTKIQLHSPNPFIINSLRMSASRGQVKSGDLTLRNLIIWIIVRR